MNKSNKITNIKMLIKKASINAIRPALLQNGSRPADFSSSYKSQTK